MEAHAELAESERAQGCFAALDESKTLRCNFRAVRQARGETGGGGAVPGGQACTTRKQANFGFAEAGIDCDALAATLQDEGAKSFVKSWNDLMGVIASKCEVLEKAS